MKSKTYICFASPAVSFVVLCLAFGVAFAQTRPSKPTGTIKTKVGSSAVIERPASSFTKIKGRILDPNNETAYGARIVALPATSCAASIRLNNKEGYFELPWSPKWLEEGQPILLIAQGPYQRNNEAAVIKVTDPMLPVTIHLKPAATLEGKVVDPNGQRIGYRATLSLQTKFKCQAPIRATKVGPPRVRIFTLIPYGQKYKLTIQAEGYQTKHLTVDATDRSIEVIDIGTITLQRQDPVKPIVAEQGPNPDLAKEFHDIYCLEENEVIKLIKPPFLLGRQDYFNHLSHNYFLGLSSGGCFHFGFDWDGELHPRYGNTSHYQRLERILQRILHIPIYDFNLPEKLNLRLDASDWIVRRGLPLEKQLRALEEIIYAELHRSIRFEKRTAEREVIVAKGRFEFKPLRSEDPNWLYLFLDENDRLGGPIVSLQPDSVSELLLRIANARGVGTAIEDKTEPCEIPKIRCRCSTSLIIDMSKARERNLPILFDNLAKQTGLRFKVERQSADIWFVTETKGN